VLAELGDITWFTKFSQLRKLAGLDIVRVQSGQWAGTARISRCGRPLLRWARSQAALGACRTPAWRAKRASLRAKRQGRVLQDERRGGGDAPARDLGRLAQRPAVPGGPGRGAGGVTWAGLGASRERSRACNVAAPHAGDRGRDFGAPLPLPPLGLGRVGTAGSAVAA